MIERLKIGGASADIPSDYKMAMKINEIIDTLSLTTKSELDYEEILKQEGLSDWTLKWNTGGGLCVYSKKEIWLDDDKANMALFLHEVAHALCPKEKCGICWVETNNGHNAIWGDKFTELVKKYMSASAIREYLTKGDV